MGQSIVGVLGMSVLLLVACGGRAQDSMPAAGSAGSLEGGASSGGSGAAGSDEGSRPDAGSAGAVPESPSVDITGRWGLFDFEDNLGVQVTQTAERLAGEGCAGGTPPLVDRSSLCGTVEGTLQGQHAQFAVRSEPYEYLADVSVSADGTRMTGRFHGITEWLPWSTTWLRIADDQSWLTTPPPPYPESRVYTLELTDADGVEYAADRPLRLIWSYRGSLQSALGAFWNTEIAISADGSSLEVGPVALTEPQLAVSMSARLADDEITELTAVTGSGHHYSFRVTPGYDGP